MEFQIIGNSCKSDRRLSFTQLTHSM